LVIKKKDESIKIFGSNIWFQHLVPTFGSNIWFQHLVPTFG